MAVRSSRTRALLALVAAHKELSIVELREAQGTAISAAFAVIVAGVCGLIGWGALNAGIVLLLGREPWQAACAVGGANLVIALVAGLRIRSLVKRPLLEHTRREVARDAKNMLELVS
jgi:uncharacterized membrane protein YqjE